jgi:hypothetical protein
MSGLIIVFLIWCVIAVPVGFAFAKMEQKVNNLPEARTKSAILLSVFLGPIGWIILAARSGMRFASSFNQSQQLQAEAARRQLREPTDSQPNEVL